MNLEPIKGSDLVEEVISKRPETTAIFMNHGMPCLVCGEALWGTIEENATRYKVNLGNLLRDLNIVRKDGAE